ncbi:MAG: flagellar basal body L-ring protein FlgH [Deltaproteobacteria bacterium]|nr:flagellar basal body L-ring protein FlgH [Deltaproteobacteria bacterium]MBI4796872.1 flagellar basal body L-ring protein FlgH [Deltaproteobacteria bacterium]
MSLYRIPSLWVILGLALLIGACVSPNHSKSQGVVMEPPKALPLPLSPPPQEGSLWTPKNPRGLLADLRACNVGDIITVSITESSKAGDEASTSADKTSGVKVGITSLLGLRLPQMKTFNDETISAENAIEGAVGNTSKGQGKTERQSTFTTYLTTRVIQILPNNNLVIQGQRQMKINNETEVVSLSGIVRPEDLDTNNTVASTKVAEARMEISGFGVVSDKQRQGWLTRIIDHIWPW